MLKKIIPRGGVCIRRSVSYSGTIEWSFSWRTHFRLRPVLLVFLWWRGGCL